MGIDQGRRLRRDRADDGRGGRAGRSLVGFGAVAGLALLLGLSACAPPEAPTPRLRPADPARGLDLAETWCMLCHDVAPDRPGDLEAGATPFAALAARPGTTADSLRAFMNEVHPVMTVGEPFPMPTVVLYPAEKEDLIAYILSLAPDA